MSMLRFLSLSPSRAGPSSPSSPRRRTTRGIKISLRVPSWGSVFMPFPNPVPDPNTPRQDKELSGDLEIEIPAGSGKLRCKAIRVGVKTSCKLDMGLDRGHEDDVIWLGKAEVIGGTADGIILEEGLQRFAFTIIIPANLATHDFHPGHRIDNTLFAEVEGMDDTSHLSHLFRRGTISSSSRGTSPSSYGSRSRLGTPTSSPSSSPHMSPPQSLTMMRQEFSLPLPPAYDLNDPTPLAEDIPWLSGTHRAERDLILLYNPDPAGGVNSLDSRVDGDVQGLGPYTMSFLADEWCISALLKAKVALPAPSPKTTIYWVNVLLVQKAEITSPRDGAKRIIERVFPITSEGVALEPKTRVAKKNQPAIWRGKEAGGDDDWELVLDGQGRLPNDYQGRPSTLQGVETPIQVSHSLRTEVWFAVKGEDARGQPINEDSPGELRVLRVDKHTIVPACFLIPEVLDLPKYRDHRTGCYLVGGDRDVESEFCPLCKTPATDQFCRTCPLTTIPHPRHDHPKKLVGTADGTCPSCTHWIIPNASPMEWRACACGMSREEIIARMKRMSQCDREEAEEEEEVRGRRGREEKEQAERGRMMACGVDLHGLNRI